MSFQRAVLACVLLVAPTRLAIADAKVKELIKFYTKEASTCQKNARGVRVVIERGEPVATVVTELADDLRELTKAQATVQAHCDELESMLDFLNADPRAAYKDLKKEADERDGRIRSGRAASRQALADAEARISRSVPLINKALAESAAAARPSTRELKEAADKAAAEKAAAEKAAADKAAAEKAASKREPPPVPKPVPAKSLAKFPSGRTVELPAPSEAWTLSGTADADIIDYAFAGAKATIVVRRHAGAPACDLIRTSMELASGRTPPKSSKPGRELEALKPSWVLGWSEGDHDVRVLCIATKTGTVAARAEASVGPDAPVDTVLARMISAR